VACRECGADYRSGWREDADDVDGLGIEEEDDFDYDEFVAREFGGGVKPKGVKVVWWVTAGVLVVAFLWMVLRG
jgi:hypothetical protein